MIIEKGGRSRSERTVDELKALLKQEIDQLTKEERIALEYVLQELEGKAPPEGARGLISTIGSAEWKRTPVDMKTFILDDYYLGKTCDNVYPKLLLDLSELFSGGYNEAIFTGSIGWGKTFIASIGVCRVLYELSCMVDPHRSFGLGRGSDISILALSVSESLATRVAFGNIASKISASPYFKENFSFEQTKKELRFPGNIWVAARASSDTSALGLNAIGAILDETNFMPKTASQTAGGQPWGHYDHAETLYNTVKRRMTSRFEHHGKLPGMLFVVSSKKTFDDFTAKRVRESKTDPNVFVRDYALWDIKPEDYYSAEKFHVVCGNEQTPSRVLPEGEVAAVRSTLPEGATLIEVPEDFRKDFERDLEGSIRDLAGVSTLAINPFIPRREKILEAIDKRAHPFSSLAYDRSLGGQFQWGQMVTDFKEREFGVEIMRKRPLLNPRALRHIHIDPALRGDSAGFCMAHVGGWKDVIRKSDDGSQYSERAPVYVVDVLLKIVPPPGGEIVLGDVRRLIYELSDHGYTITSVSLDQFQSADMIQQLSQRGYSAKLQSVDITPDPYENLKTALYENRLFYYEYAPLIQELQTLEDNRGGRRRKIDHPPRGSKDVSDALAGTLWTLSETRLSMPLPILKGEKFSPDQELWMPEQMSAAGAGNPGAGQHMDLPLPFLTSGRSWGGGGTGRY